MADNDACLQERLDRARFRAWRRGFREADLVLGPFVEQVGPTLDAGEMTEFEALLDAEDHQLYGWIIGRDETPPEHDGPVMARIRAFMHEHVAAAVAGGAG